MSRWASYLLVGGAVVTIGAVTWVHAQDKPKPSAADRQARILKQHPEADTNGDGALSDEERKAYFSQRRQDGRGPGQAGGPPPGPHGEGRPPGPPIDREQLLKDHPELDTNQDGTLDDAEMRAAGPKVRRMMADSFRPSPMFFDWLIKNFDKADMDGDGKLSKDELQQFRAKMGPPGGDRPEGDRPGRPGEDLIKRHPEADTDGNGQISREEFRAYMEKEGPQLRQEFLQLHPDADTDKDGQLSNEEFRAARQKNRADRGDRPPPPEGQPGDR